MIRIYIATRSSGPVVGRIDTTDMDAWVRNLLGLDYAHIKIEDPVSAATMQVPVVDEQRGLVQTIDGKWINKQQAAQVPMEYIMTRTHTTMAAYRVAALYLSTDDIVVIRELNDEERNDYNKAIQTVALQNTSGLITGVPAGLKLVKDEEEKE